MILIFSFPIFANGQSTAIRPGNIVHPESGKIESNQIMLIKGQNIKAIDSNLPIPKDAKVIDLSKKE